MNDQPTTDVITRDKRRAELSQLSFSGGSQIFQPKSGQELMDMSNLMSTCGFMVKDLYRGNPGACMGLIAICAPYGLNPIQVSWKTYKASKGDDAPIAFEAQVIVAMVNASGVVKGGLRYRYEGDGQTRICIASGLLSGSNEAVEVRSPMVAQITLKNSPLWKTDPDQQLAYYTGRSWARRYKPEMLLGVYDVDELEGSPIRDVTPREPGPMAQKAMAAREAAKAPTPEPEVQDAEVVHWTATINADDAFPGSDAFTDGATAFADGLAYADNPNDGDEQMAADWAGGWLGAERAAQ